MSKAKIRIKRAYEPPADDDGFRVLIDRLWPRGVSKEDARVDLWLQEIAPSHELRKWFKHDPVKWNEFLKRYKKEIEGTDALRRLRELAREHKTVTLVFAAQDERHSNAAALEQWV